VLGKVGAHLAGVPSQDVTSAGGVGQQGAGVGEEGEGDMEFAAA
jgi:hypothetical protein